MANSALLYAGGGVLPLGGDTKEGFNMTPVPKKSLKMLSDLVPIFRTSLVLNFCPSRTWQTVQLREKPTWQEASK